MCYSTRIIYINPCIVHVINCILYMCWSEVDNENMCINICMCTSLLIVGRNRINI